VLENLLYTALGALVATLIALLLAPAIWRRAVALTRTRLEQAMPLTLAELQAEKDQLRASHAVEVRRLEVRASTLTREAAQNAIEINRKRDDLLDASQELTRKNDCIVELESEAAARLAETADLRESYDGLSRELDAARDELQYSTEHMEELDTRYQGAIEDFDLQKIETVARETRLHSSREEADELRETSRRNKEALDQQGLDLKLALENVAKQKQQVGVQKRKVTLLEKRQAELEAKLKKSEADLKRSKGRAAKPGAALKEAEAEIDRLHEELAEQAGNTSSEEADSETSQALIRAEAEAEALRVELATLRIAGDGGALALEKEHSALRDMISDLAAQITAQVANEEGSGSKIDQALAKHTRDKDDGEGEGDVTLADRIRKVQKQKKSKTAKA
jgi:chromosome segregation ATPase